MSKVLDFIFGDRVARDTSRYIAQLSAAPKEAARLKAGRLVSSFNESEQSKVRLGSTQWNTALEVPLLEMLKAHSLVTGGTGSGKSMFALLIIKSLIEKTPHNVGFGILDAKGELFLGALWLLKTRLEALSKTDPEAAKRLRRRIVIYDFASRDPVSPYNILASWTGADPEYFALNRADLLMDLLDRGDKLSLGGVGVLQKLLMLLAEFSLPITGLSDLIRDDRVMLHCSKTAQSLERPR